MEKKRSAVTKKQNTIEVTVQSSTLLLTYSTYNEPQIVLIINVTYLILEIIPNILKNNLYEMRFYSFYYNGGMCDVLFRQHCKHID